MAKDTNFKFGMYAKTLGGDMHSNERLLVSYVILLFIRILNGFSVAAGLKCQ